MKVTSAFNFVVEVIVCDTVVSYVLRSPDGKPLYTSDDVTEVVSQMGNFVSEFLEVKSRAKWFISSAIFGRGRNARVPILSIIAKLTQLNFKAISHMINKQDLSVKVDFGKTLPSAEKIFARMVDVDTGEVLYDASKVVGFSCCANGEGYIHSLFASFVRGLRSTRNLSIEITATPVHSDSVVPALF